MAPNFQSKHHGCQFKIMSRVLANMKRVSDLNNLNCKGMWDATIFIKLKMRCILCIYWQGFDDLFATVTFLLQNSPGSVFITTHHNISGHHLIEFLIVKWGLKCTKLLDGFSFMPSVRYVRYLN
ncbi:hypothetical protein HYC85_005797 [Camellia sinensis]|uniref:Uncharacterized protein n=1 Tax=Camellia sinensis TaxID=4442 RepID=A0A7J7I0I2_CAMSI|nr:hypothetical protein HYC85_005797 [Camellia sinensis]